MRRMLFVGVLAVFTAQCIQAQLITNSPVMQYLSKGTLNFEGGVAFNYKENRDSDQENPGLAWGLIDVLYQTPATYGFSAGVGAIGVTEVWENNDGDYDAVFPEQLDLKHLFLDYDIMETSNTLTIGRTLFEENPGFCGHSHQGVQLIVDGIPNISLSAAVIERWVHHDTIFFDADGYDGWKNVDEANEDAGTYFYAASLDTYWIEKRLTVTPFVCHQENVLSVYGGTLTAAQPIKGDWKATFTGTGALYVNNVPESIQPDYEDVTSALIHAGVSSELYALGLGWFYASDDRNDLSAGIFQDFDPLEEDDLMPYNDQNNCHMYYIDGNYAIGAFSTQVAFGFGKNDALDAKSKELDVWLYYDITPHVQLGGYVVWTKYDTDVIDSYNQYGSALTYSF